MVNHGIDYMCLQILCAMGLGNIGICLIVFYCYSQRAALLASFKLNKRIFHKDKPYVFKVPLMFYYMG